MPTLNVSLLGQRLAVSLAGVAIGAASVSAAELPVACTSGSCTGIPTFVTGGQATAVVTGSTLTVNQQSTSAILNWQSFNVSADGTVNFVQPSAAAVAINRIHETTSPSTLSGTINANGRVYLLNRNGIIFGDGAQINVGGLAASSLDLTPEALERGIAGAIDALAPAFRLATGANGSVEVQPGATINAPGGQVLLFAPEVTNRGVIKTPDGQTILAAGEQVFLAASSDQDLRGLFVEVRGSGAVINGEDANAGRAATEQLGRIIADRGNVTLAGMLVRQQGQVSATTSTRANGTIRLLARSASSSSLSPTAVTLQTETLADTGGDLFVGAGSSTAVTLDATDTSETVDVNAQPVSAVQLSGRRIEIGSSSEIIATAGEILAVAAARPNAEVGGIADNSRLVIASGARLDVSGARIELPVERNVIRVELRGSQLADSPEQRAGPLRSQPVFVDIRESGIRPDGSAWIGTPLADVSGDVSNLRRGIGERSLEAGSITLESQGAVVVGSGVALDVSGGAIDWQPGYTTPSQVLGADGHIYAIANADRDLSYLGLVDGYSVTDQRWGATRTYSLAGIGQQGRFEAGYTEGYAAGSIAIAAPQVILDGDVLGATLRGPNQRYETTAPGLTGSQFDLIPRAARLALGRPVFGTSPPDYLLDDVEVRAGLGAPGGIANLLQAEQQLTGLTTTRVRSELLVEGRVGELSILSNLTVRIVEGNPVTLPANGRLSITSGRIDVDAGISVPSGTVLLSVVDTALSVGSLTATPHAFNLATGAAISTAGQWINDDFRLTGGIDLSPLNIDGGRVSIAISDGPLTLGASSVIDVSAGAWRRADSTIVDGTAGSIALAAQSPLAFRPATVRVGGALSGFALSHGGSLSITAPSVCIATGACGGQNAAGLQLDSGWLVSNGFETLSLGTNLGDLVVAAGTTLELGQLNFALLDEHRDAPSLTPFASLVTTGRVPDHLRRPANLTLTAAYGSGAGFTGAADLRLQAGSAVVGDPLSRITLATDSSAYLDGLLRAPGGQIALSVGNTSIRGYVPTQGVWVGERGVLDVSGTTQYTPNPLGLRIGEVLAGGSVAIDLQRGFVVTQPGSVIDASGTAGMVDLRGPTGLYSTTSVASAGGSIALRAAEGIQVSGDLRALSGDPGSVAGGFLDRPP